MDPNGGLSVVEEEVESWEDREPQGPYPEVGVEPEEVPAVPGVPDVQPVESKETTESVAVSREASHEAHVHGPHYGCKTRQPPQGERLRRAAQLRRSQVLGQTVGAMTQAAKTQKALVANQTYYINVRYVMMCQKGQAQVSLARVKAMHKMLNAIYSATNSGSAYNYDLDKLNSARANQGELYNYEAANMGIQFLPTNPEDVRVEYVELLCPTICEGEESPVDAAHQLDPISRVDHVKYMNVYMGYLPVSLEGLLGEAGVESNICFLAADSVGGYDVGGQSLIDFYKFGKTAAHELGHALSLFHTFESTEMDEKGNFVGAEGLAAWCNGQSELAPDWWPTPVGYADIPEQILPNFEAYFYNVGTTREPSWEVRGDNRAKDRARVLTGADPTRSCVGDVDTTLSSKNECAMNIMDYGNNEVSVMFTPTQVQQVRGYLGAMTAYSYLSPTPNMVSYSQYLQSLETPAAETPTPAPTTVVVASKPDTVTVVSTPVACEAKQTSFVTSTWFMALMVLLGVMLVALLYYKFGRGTSPLLSTLGSAKHPSTPHHGAPASAT
jgi:hypothetical protein